jgi:hypothetical protein
MDMLNSAHLEPAIGAEMINAGSHSRLSVFESCNLRARLQFVDKIPEPTRPPLPAGKEYPDARGTRVHQETDAFIKGNTDAFPIEALAFKDHLTMAQGLYADGKAAGESSWCFDANWNPLIDPFTYQPPNWNIFHQIRFRIKPDLVITANKEEALVVDYKTGKRYGNEMKHGEQLELYSIGAFIQYPTLETVTAELWYFDIQDLVSLTFTKAEASRRLQSWDMRNKIMMDTREFPPMPNMETCRWCPYGPAKSGHCKDGIQ